MLLTLVVLQATVRFSAPADNAARLLPKLGAAVGLRLEADRRAGQQVLLIRVEDLEPSRLLKTIATVSGGSWETIRGGYRLTIGNSELNALWKEETRRRAVWLESSRDALRQQGPEKAALAEALASIPVAALASIRQGERFVWSTTPTAYQRALPRSAFGALQALAEATLKRYETIAKRPGMIMEKELFEDLRMPTQTVLVAARRGIGFDSVGVSLRGFGPNGRSKAATEVVLRPPIDLQSTGTTDIDLSINPEVQAWALATVLGKPSSELAAKLLQPDVVDPLSVGVGPAFDSLARSMGKGVVAVLPDSCYNPIGSALGSSKKRSDLLKSLAMGGLEIQNEGDLLIGSPREPSTVLETRLDRVAFRRLIDARQRNGAFDPQDDLSPTLTQAVLNTIQQGALLSESQSNVEPFARLISNTRWSAQGVATEVATDATFYQTLFRSLSRTDLESERTTIAGPYLMEPTAIVISRNPMRGLRLSTEVVPTVIVQTPSEVFTRTGESLFEVVTMLRLTGSWPLESPQNRYWQAERKISTFSWGPSQADGLKYLGRIEETRRIDNRVFSYPKLFPELQQEIERQRANG